MQACCLGDRSDASGRTAEPRSSARPACGPGPGERAGRHPCPGPAEKREAAPQAGTGTRLGPSAVVQFQLYPVPPIRGLITDLKVTCTPTVLLLIMLLKQQPWPCQHGGFHRVRSPAWSQHGCYAAGVWPVSFEGMESL